MKKQSKKQTNKNREEKELKSKRKKASLRKPTLNKSLPFTIHTCPPGPDAFPSHTHGLTEIGKPEFLVDPLAFGPNGNARLINAAFEYFENPDNQDKLQAIINKGKTIKVTSTDLYPTRPDAERFVYCFRKVTKDFEAVKMAYFPPEITDEMNIIQIYVEGDDFALTDEYYRGGITPVNPIYPKKPIN